MSCREKGFTLIEALIAIAVLAIVLGGIGGSLVSGLRGMKNAYMRDLATTAAAEMADRMRANMPAVNGAFAGAYVWPAANDGTASRFGPAAVDCQSVGCTSDLVAQSDLADWFAMLRSGDLGPAQGRVQCIAGALPEYDMYQISVMWDARRSGVAGTGCSGNPAVDLTCYRVTFLP